MEAFTFATLTYNQEKYILEHLESIRYQIEHFGKGRDIYYVLADDCSTDQTIDIATKWLDKNRDSFQKIEIVISSENQGIVRNYENALRHIHTNQFKLLAGDDLYYCESIFEAAEQGDFVMCPVLCFGEDGVDRTTYRFRYWTHKEWLATKERNLKEKLMHRMHVKNCIIAPGVVWNLELADEGLFQELQQFQWIEDYPSWQYILSKDHVVPKVYDMPVVLYRLNQGVSHRKSTNKRKKLFEAELLQQYRRYGSPLGALPRKVNPYAYGYYIGYYIKACWYWLVADHTKEILKKFDNQMQMAYNRANDYIRMIRENAEKCC